MALGARVRTVIRMMMGETCLIVAAGVSAGLLGTAATTRLINNLLFGLKPTDPLTLAAAAFILVVVTGAAAYIPARRASRIDPLAALRHE